MRFLQLIHKQGIKEEYRHLVELHFWIFLNSFIPSINIFISLSSVQIVFIRTFIAFTTLGILIYRQRLHFRLPWSSILELLFTGVMTSFYWIFFVIAAKIGNASVALVGVATTPLWVSLIAPFLGLRHLRFNEIMMGLNAIFGVYMIFSSSFAYSEGMVMAILAAFFAALVTVVSSKYSKEYHHRVITFYQMLGAWIGTILVIPLFQNYLNTGEELWSVPTLTDCILVVVLAIIFSIIAFSSIIKVMSSLTPFQVSIAHNLSPIYGGVAALLLFGEQEVMDVYFYAGALIIIASLTAPPLAKKIFGNKRG
ncbi:DMT family transporter [Algivirga pacifica]|uniref:EamA domain-containing protein n=1 Tax=Algivirga pacifica TaxID=1162670 RepID=A0ABP9D177_9BACT